MTDEMVDRVAKALFEHWAADPFSRFSIHIMFGVKEITWEQATSPNYVRSAVDIFREQARVAIAAMHEGLH